MKLTWMNILGEAAWVMLLAVGLAGAAVVFRPALRPMITGGQPWGAESPGSMQSGIPTITLDEARSRFEAGQALFADARPLRAYQKGHIKGAMPLDLSEFDAWSEKFFSQFSAETLIITYCDGQHCSLSMDLAQKLTEMGYENVFVLKNGWHQWTAAHLPIEQSLE